MTANLYEDPTSNLANWFAFDAVLHADGRVLSEFDTWITALPLKGQLRQFDDTVVDGASLPVKCTDAQHRMM